MMKLIPGKLVYEYTGKDLKAFRESIPKMNKGKFARLVGYSVRQIAHIENKNRPVTDDLIKAMLEVPDLKRLLTEDFVENKS